MSKKIYYTEDGATCSKCKGLLIHHPFDEGEQHRAMSKHVCPHDVAQERLEYFATQLEEFLQRSEFSLEVNVSANVDAWMELRDGITGVKHRMGSELG